MAVEENEEAPQKNFRVTLTFPLVSKSNESVSQVTLHVTSTDEQSAIREVFNLGAVQVDDDSLALDENIYYVVQNAVRIHIQEASE